MLRTKTIAAAAFCAFTVAGVGAAQAGEVTGNGDPTGATGHANSICVFSGLNDDPDAPTSPPLGENGPGGTSQSFGQENRLGLIDPHDTNPGTECRGGSNPFRD